MGARSYDVAVVGAGLSGLTAAALLARSGLSVLVLERNYMPGGACGAFRRKGVTFDLGAAMLFGFGERGFNPHRFVMNELEEPIEVIRHKALYRLNYGEEPIVFWPDRERFYGELDRVFPGQTKEIRAFYSFIVDLYENVIAADPVFIAPSEMRKSDLAAQFRRHPIKRARTVALLFTSAGRLIRRFVRSPEVVKFFNKLTSTYCYTTMDETPAILASTMFVDNHTGGSYYPVGSPAMLSGRLEKAIEKNGGTILYETEVTGILFDGERVSGVRTRAGEEFRAADVIYAGAVKNLYGKLLPRERTTAAERAKVEALVMTWPSVVLYGTVRADAIPPGTFPVEMFVDNRESLDESEVTIYISSLEDPSLCLEGKHVFTMIGPSFERWPAPGAPEDRGPALRREETGRGESSSRAARAAVPRFPERHRVLRDRKPHDDRALSAQERRLGGRAEELDGTGADEEAAREDALARPVPRRRVHRHGHGDAGGHGLGGQRGGHGPARTGHAGIPLLSRAEEPRHGRRGPGRPQARAPCAPGHGVAVPVVRDAFLPDRLPRRDRHQGNHAEDGGRQLPRSAQASPLSASVPRASLPALRARLLQDQLRRQPRPHRCKSGVARLLGGSGMTPDCITIGAGMAGLPCGAYLCAGGRRPLRLLGRSR